MERDLIFGGVNPDGAQGKWATIKKAVKDTGASVWMMQETKCKLEGRLKLDGFITYEHLRSDRDGGGLALSVRKELSPALVRDGGETVEALTVNIHLKKMTISCTTAYGPQENADIEKKKLFWNYLGEEANKAKTEGYGFLLQGDLNAWLGFKIIPGDKREQNRNGKMFERFLKENKLTVVNSLPLCQGLETRRLKKGVLVESIIDFYVVCEHVLTNVIKMKIDSDRKHILTNYNRVKKGGNAINTDHLTTTLKVNLKVTPEKPIKVEIFNFNDPKGKEKFKTSTTSTNEFSNCFMNNKPVHIQVQDWLSILMIHCKNAFPKIRIRSKNIKPSKANSLIDKRNKLAITNDHSEEIKKITEDIAEILKEEQRSKAHIFKKYCDQGNTVNVAEMWKIKKKLWPKKKNALPVAKINHKGKLVSAPADIWKLLQKNTKKG